MRDAAAKAVAFAGDLERSDLERNEIVLHALVRLVSEGGAELGREGFDGVRAAVEGGGRVVEMLDLPAAVATGRDEGLDGVDGWIDVAAAGRDHSGDRAQEGGVGAERSHLA